MRLSNNVKDLTGQPMFKILQRAQELERAGNKMFHFELGDPCFATPYYIVDAAVESLKDDRTHYSPSQGEHNLLEAARTVTERSRGFKPDIDQLLVTNGANMQIYLALAAICNRGDSVLIPDPYFPSYHSQIKSLGLNAVPIKVEENYKMSATKMDKLCSTHHPKVIILNSPSNPTGAVYTDDELAKIYYVAVKYDIVVISDEVYSRHIYDKPFCSISYWDNCKVRVIVVNGLSKSFAMTGWRIGVVTGPSEIVEKMTVLLETICSCVPQFIQDAATEALLEDEGEIDLMISKYKNKRDLMIRELSKIPSLKCSVPDGGMYCWARITNGMMSQEYAEYAMKRGVVLSPGHIFGSDEHVRFAFCVEDDVIKEGIVRLKDG